MITLKDILYKVSLEKVVGNTAVAFRELQFDSRKVGLDDVFIAIKGTQSDGHQFIKKAIDQGALAVVCQQMPKEIINGITYLQVQDTQQALAIMASHFYGNPSRELQLVGVTGTNGKTTVATLLFKLFSALGYYCGLVSTVQNQIGDTIIPSTHTTPDAIQLNALLDKMVQAGCTHVFMECSSHAIHQHRITGLQFTGGAFTNLTLDHLDYHKTMQAYFEAKTELFTSEYAQKAVINIDDAYGEKLSNQTQLPVISVSRKKSSADWYFEKAELRNNSYDVEIKGIDGEVVKGNFPLIGDYNLDNLILAVAITHQLGISGEQISNTLSRLKSVPGRLETVNAGQSFIGLVDYAHTPDAVQNVIATARKLTSGKVIGVLGCGGDRDNSKRPLMGQALFQGCDVSIFTSDNPRSESADSILKEMISGLDLGQKGEVCIDRREAISLAVNKANAGDVVLIMGKGHESGQEINGVITPFDDRLELTQAILKQGNK